MLCAGAMAAAVLGMAACGTKSEPVSQATGNGLGESAPLEMRAANAGVALLDAESEVTHTHTELIVIVDGEAVEVPANIGVDEAAGKIAALHTHRTDGILHVESPVQEDRYTLDQFYQLYGVGSTKTDICKKYSETGLCTMKIVSEQNGETDMNQILQDGDRITLTVSTIA
jgi:hypothetical protein